MKVYFIGSYSTAEERGTKVEGDAGEPNIKENAPLNHVTEKSHQMMNIPKATH